MIVALDHIAIAVPELQAAINRFAEDFGLKFAGTQAVESAQTMTAFFPIEGTQIELIHPLNGQGPVQSLLKREVLVFITFVSKPMTFMGT